MTRILRKLSDGLSRRDVGDNRNSEARYEDSRRGIIEGECQGHWLPRGCKGNVQMLVGNGVSENDVDIQSAIGWPVIVASLVPPDNVRPESCSCPTSYSVRT